MFHFSDFFFNTWTFVFMHWESRNFRMFSLNFNPVFHVWIETLCCCRHYVVSVRGSGPRSIPRHGPHPVCDYGGGPCALPEEDCYGESHLSGHFSVWYPFLDVLHPSRSHWAVNTSCLHTEWNFFIVWIYITNINRNCILFCYFVLLGVSVRTWWLSSGTLWSASTLVCQPTRSVVATLLVCWATSWPKAIIMSTFSSSRGENHEHASLPCLINTEEQIYKLHTLINSPGLMILHDLDK